MTSIKWKVKQTSLLIKHFLLFFFCLIIYDLLGTLIWKTQIIDRPFEESVNNNEPHRYPLLTIHKLKSQTFIESQNRVVFSSNQKALILLTLSHFFLFPVKFKTISLIYIIRSSYNFTTFYYYNRYIDEREFTYSFTNICHYPLIKIRDFFRRWVRRESRHELLLSCLWTESWYEVYVLNTRHTDITSMTHYLTENCWTTNPKWQIMKLSEKSNPTRKWWMYFLFYYFLPDLLPLHKCF